MSTPEDQWINNNEVNMEGNSSDCSEEEVPVISLNTDDNNINVQRNSSSSSTNSNSSSQLRIVKSLAELPLRKKNARKKYQQRKRRLAQVSNNSHPTKVRAYDESLGTMTPKIDTENAPYTNNRYEIKVVGNVKSTDPFTCSLYITSYNVIEDQLSMPIATESFIETLARIASGKIRIQKTCCGVTVMFTKEDDADKVISLPLQKIFGGPVQVARFLTGGYKFRHNIIIKDIPWCISNTEIYQALKTQGIRIGKMERTKHHAKVEVFNALDMHRLLEEGLNFFNCTSFSTVSENLFNHGDSDIIQCYKCQGFWHTSTHCRQTPRCVRCGENHDVEYCPRPRNAPICCHCGGPHHAAYKMCPVRLQHIKSIYVGFTLSKDKPVRTYQNVF